MCNVCVPEDASAAEVEAVHVEQVGVVAAAHRVPEVQRGTAAPAHVHRRGVVHLAIQRVQA
jgi:hypothetical protein